MFTGLIEHVGTVARAMAAPSGLRLEIDPRGWEHRPGLGESIAINGCCLTIADERAKGGGVMAFDLVPETLSLTTLGRLVVGSRVNLERSATPQTLLGGHVVQGHVDGMGRVEAIAREGQWRIRIGVGPELIEYVTPKGSIAVEGVSLTVAGVRVERGGAERVKGDAARVERGGVDQREAGPAGAGVGAASGHRGGGDGDRGANLEARAGASMGGWFEIALIPTTLAKTTLGELAVGDLVNLETDVVGRTIVHWLRNFGGRGDEGAVRDDRGGPAAGTR